MIFSDFNPNFRQKGGYRDASKKTNPVAALFVNPSWDNAQEVNARYAFLCGLAIALGKRVQMIGLPGYQSAFDYKELLKQADSPSLAVKIVKQAFQPMVRCESQ